MSESAKIFSNNFLHIIKIFEYMAQPNGTSIEELCQKLRITRRSVFRLFNTIENKLNIPIEIRRETFGGKASYKIPSSFIKNFSNIKLPAVSLSFNQAILIYILLNEGFLTKSSKIAREDDSLREKLMSAFNPKRQD
jgi:predicted DNA-binding transcriptional regulator YafY